MSNRGKAIIRQQLVEARNNARSLEMADGGADTWTIDLELMIMDCIEFLDDPKDTEVSNPVLIEDFKLDRFIKDLKPKQQKAFLHGFAKCHKLTMFATAKVRGVFRLPDEHEAVSERLTKAMVELCNHNCVCGDVPCGNCDRKEVSNG